MHALLKVSGQLRDALFERIYKTQMWQPVDLRKAPVEGPGGMVGLGVLDGVRVGTLPTEWMWLAEVSLRSPRLRVGIGKKMAISSLRSPVYVPKVEFMWCEPRFLGKSAWLVMTLSSGTGTDVEGWPRSQPRVAFPASSASPGLRCCIWRSARTASLPLPARGVLAPSGIRSILFVISLLRSPVSCLHPSSLVSPREQSTLGGSGDPGQALPLPFISPGTGHQGRGDWGCLSLLLVGCSCSAKICLSLFSSPSSPSSFPP